jgi:hypothetical protein
MSPPRPPPAAPPPAPGPRASPGIARRAVGRLAIAAAAVACVPALVRARLRAPEGPVLLTVSGAVRYANGAAGARFDDAMLSALPQVSFETATIWTPRRRFSGPPLAAVLAAAGAAGGPIEALAANDYRIMLDRALIGDNAPIIANRIDGAPFGLRALGPLWIMFPFDDVPAFRVETVYAQCVWQLVELRVAAA